jgi:hypothetical protein
MSKKRAREGSNASREDHASIAVLNFVVRLLRRYRGTQIVRVSKRTESKKAGSLPPSTA